MQRKFKFALCIFLAIVALLCTASAVDIYVSADGDDTAAGTADAPVATLTQAYTLLGTDGGTVLLADTVPVTATSGDCYIEPTHRAKITVTSAPDANGALDLTGIEHFHFSGETEWNSIGIVANEVVLTADNNIVTMGQGLTVSSPSSNTEYRGGHRFCGAKLHLAAYAPCDTVDRSITTADGRLNVYSGEYRSISAWYGGGVTLAGGKTKIRFGESTGDGTVWVCRLCPGLIGTQPDAVLSLTKQTTVEMIVLDSINAVETYRTTQHTLDGNLYVRWLLRDSIQGDATAVTAWDAAFAEDATCTIIVYASECEAAANASAALLLRNTPSIGTYTLRALANYSHAHEIYTAFDGRILCRLCEYEQCRHRTITIVETTPADERNDAIYTTYCTDVCGQILSRAHGTAADPHDLQTLPDGRIVCTVCTYEQCRHLMQEYKILTTPTCTTMGQKRLKCTDICGRYLANAESIASNPNCHTGNYIKTTYDPARNRMAHRCSGCNVLFIMQSGQPAETVYVGSSTGTPIDIDNIAEHYAESLIPVGSSPLYPFTNFEDAMYYAAKAAAIRGSATVCILDDAYVPASYCTPYTSGTTTITGGTLHFDTNTRYFKMYGDIVFEHIVFKTDPPEENSSGNLVIMSRNYRLVMGEGIVMGNENTVNTEYGFPPCNGVKMYVIGGFVNPENVTMNTNITIRSGDYWYVGGWNMGTSAVNGTSHITVGKTDSNDKLQIFYLCPFSHGNGCITESAESTMVFDGEASIKRLYVTTLNQASLDIDYVANIVLRGDIKGYNNENDSLQYDIRGTADNDGFPKTIINLYTDARVATAVDDSYVFLGRKNPHFAPPDSTLRRISANVNAYSYEDYCQTKLGGHDQSGEGGSCSKCGYVAPQDPEPNPAQE